MDESGNVTELGPRYVIEIHHIVGEGLSAVGAGLAFEESHVLPDSLTLCISLRPVQPTILLVVPPVLLFPLLRILRYQAPGERFELSAFGFRVRCAAIAPPRKECRRPMVAGRSM